MNKFGFLIALFAITLGSCTNKSKTQDATPQDATPIDQNIIDHHTSEMSVDWVGEYEGILPCDDCDGIETVIVLRENHTYVAQYRHLGKPGDNKEWGEEGAFTWNDAGSNVTLVSADETIQFKVGENQLFLITDEGVDLNFNDTSKLHVLNKRQ